MQQLRLRPVRRLPIAFGWLTKRGDADTARWIKPVLSQPEIRRDTVRVLRAAAADKRVLLRAAVPLPDFDRPALVVWARRDRVMPPEHGRRLAELLPLASLAEIDDSYTLIPSINPTTSPGSSGSSPDQLAGEPGSPTAQADEPGALEVRGHPVVAAGASVARSLSIWSSRM